MRQVAAVREVHPHERVARLDEAEIDGHVGLRAGMGLHVRIRRAKELFHPVPREVLGHVHEFAAAVVPLAGVSLGVLVRQGRTERLEHGAAHEVLGCYQLELGVLPVGLAAHRIKHFRIVLLQVSHV